MSEFSVNPMNHRNIAYLANIKKSIEIDPPYQRDGEVWSVKKQQLLIDSILNEFDVPKIYFHDRPGRSGPDGRTYRFALIDGRQRLEAVWDFIDGRFALADDFIYLSDTSIDASGMSFTELTNSHPDLSARFMASNLDVMLVRTDDDELIEEMFSRLNEAVPLNAAEKRNGRGGPLRAAVKSTIDAPFFKDRLPFSNRRYRHLDLATKFLYWEQEGGPADAKRRQLDQFQADLKTSKAGAKTVKPLVANSLQVMKALEGTFTSKDRLLSSIGMVSVYYLLFREIVASGEPAPARSSLAEFEKVRRLGRFEDESELTSAELRLLEFDRLSQSPNDSGALKFRLEVLRDYLEDPSQFPAAEEDVA